MHASANAFRCRPTPPTRCPDARTLFELRKRHSHSSANATPIPARAALSPNCPVVKVFERAGICAKFFFCLLRDSCLLGPRVLSLGSWHSCTGRLSTAPPRAPRPKKVAGFRLSWIFRRGARPLCLRSVRSHGWQCCAPVRHSGWTFCCPLPWRWRSVVLLVM